MDAQAIRLNEPLHFTKDQVKVSFKKAKDGLSYPDFDLEFDFFYVHRLNGFWGIVPAINAEAFGSSQEDLKDQLEEAIR